MWWQLFKMIGERALANSPAGQRLKGMAETAGQIYNASDGNWSPSDKIQD